MQLSENQRLKFLINELGFKTQLEFANALNIKPGSLSDILREKEGLGVSNSIKDKLDNLFFVNKEWLENGEGDIFKKNKPNNNNIRLNHHSERYEKEIPKDFLNQIRVILNPNATSNSIIKPIPVYEHSYSSGENISRLMSQTELLPTVILIAGKLHIGCDMVIKHCDIAMTKALAPGCYIGIKKLHKFANRIIPGMMGVVVLDEYTVERYVYPGEDEKHFLLRSAEPEKHSDMTIPIDEIKEMWLIKSYSMPIEIENFMY